jgi:voltage-gated potassium channel Kch
MSTAERRAALLEIASGQAGIVIGTHALLQDNVQFADLALVVVDEQHRFGVEQRDALRAKGTQPPHVLVMTATPIPRTVAMTVFGDLETSTLRELPAGRAPITSHVVPEWKDWFPRTWERVAEEVRLGRQVYVVCPRIGGDADGSDDLDGADIVVPDRPSRVAGPDGHAGSDADDGHGEGPSGEGDDLEPPGDIEVEEDRLPRPLHGVVETLAQLQAEPALAGKPFGEALSAYDACSVIGVLTEAGEVRLKPPMEMRLAKGDQLIGIAEDDSTFVIGQQKTAPEEGLVREAQPRPKKPERVLVLGWNRRATRILLELDQYVAPGSSVTVVAESATAEGQIAEIRDLVTNLDVHFTAASTTDRRVLDKLATSFDHVITLSYSDELDAQKADARTLVTLLHLRDIGAAAEHTFSITSEMLDPRNRALAEVTQADDFIVSNHLISLMLAQIAENKALNAVFADLFDPEGAEVYLKPMVDYVQCGVELNFYAVVEAARRRGEIAIGYRRRYLSSMRQHGHGVVLNPNKAERLRFGEQDSVVVVAEN